MKDSCVRLLVAAFVLSIPILLVADTNPHPLATGNFSQDWTTIGLITTNDDWSGVPAITGFRGDGLTSANDVDARTVTASDTPGTIDVNANQTNGNFGTGGVSEFHLANPVVGLAGSTTADAPYLKIFLNTYCRTNIIVSFNARDIDGSTDNAVQQIAVLYRVGNSGAFTNLPAGYIADATTGPSLATLVTARAVPLPPAADNQPLVEVRIITTNANGNDEYVGIDDITVTSDPGVGPALSIADVVTIEGNPPSTTNANFTVSLTCPAPLGGVTYDIATQDNSATDADNDYEPNNLTGQTIPMGSVTSAPFTVVVNGDLVEEPNEQYFVNVTNVSGTGVTVADGQAAGAITNDDSTPDLTVTNVTQAETNAGTTTFTFTVQLSSPALAGGVTFDIATAPDTAVAGTDYVHKQETGRTIAPAANSATFDVTVNGDAIFENDDTFFVNVTSVSGANVVDPQGLGTITNDDAQPAFSIEDVALLELNGGTQTMTFTVTKTGATDFPSSVNVATADGVATTGTSDYVANSVTPLNFAPADTMQTFDVTINGDTNPEGDEHFVVNLSGATGATISDAQAFGVIKNDEPISIAAVDTPVAENFAALGLAAMPSTPPGWTFVETGSNANLVHTPGTGSSNVGDTYNFGAAADPDRSLGGLQSGSLVPTVGAAYRNDTGVSITTLTINYIGEQWRIGNNATARDDRLDFQYSLDATSLTTGAWTHFDALDFTNPIKTAGAAGPLDGNQPANRVSIQATITGLSIPAGAVFWIRWLDFDAGGADDGLAVDDFSIVANISNVLTINDVSILEGDVGTSILQFTVTRSEPSASPTTFNITTADNSATDADNDYEVNSVVGATIPGDNVTTTYTFGVIINGDTNQEPTENFFVNISNATNATIIDSQGIGTINADDFTLTLISAVQGNGNTSPLAGSSVTVAGIVTGIKQGSSGGFFVQEELPDEDGNSSTSEGIFVFTGSSIPAGVVIGNRVAVTGTVQEFPASAAPHTVTELSGTISVSQLATGQPLPAPFTLTATEGAATTNLSQYEPWEGMRVATTLEVTAPTGGNTDENDATGSSDGVFYGVIQGVAKAFREPGIPVMDIVPTEAACAACIPRFDRNPERIRVSSTSQPGATQLNVAVGQIVSNLVGPLDYGFFEYSILPEAATVPNVSGSSTYIAVPAPLASELTVSSINLERFYDTVDDPLLGPTNEVILTVTAFNNRLNKASLAIRNVLMTPDVVGVVEVENLSALQALATKINTDTAGATNYFGYLVEGNDQGGIDVGFLVNLNRVSVTAVTQFGKTDTFIDPGDSSEDILNDRPPLMLQGTIQRTDATTYAFTVIVNHLRSLNGNEENNNTGLRVREKRRLQAEFLANFVQNRQTTNPGERIILVGDFNAFQFNDGMVDTINTIKGTPTPANDVVEPSADLVNPDLTNLVDLITAGQRYSYSFDGNLQVLDHAIVNAPAFSTYTRAAFAHFDAGFPEIFRSDASRPERISDHDGIVAYFDLSPVGALEFSAANYDVGESTTTFNVTVNRTGGDTGAVGATYTIAAGTATAGTDFTAATGTVSFADGETSKTFPVTIDNDLIDEPDQTIALSLSNPTGDATLGTQSTATITIQDDDAPPVFTIDDNTTFVEGDAGSANAQLTVTLTGATEFTTSVAWATAPDSATAGSDYTTSGATLNFPAGAGPQTQTIDVPILGDTIDEPNERLFVNLSGATNATIGDAQGEITIIDNEGTPQIIINDLSFAEGNSGTTQYSLTVTLVGATSQTVNVDWTLDPGTASCCGVDFSGPHGTLTFPSGTTSRTISATIFGETIYETNETILVNLTNAVNATIADNQGVFTINNDDPLPSITINDLSVNEGNSGTSQASLTATLSNTSYQAITLDWTLDAGTATCCGVDFSGPHGSHTFQPGQTTKTITATIFGDNNTEPDETILVNLTNATNATIADNQGVFTILNDDPDGDSDGISDVLDNCPSVPNPSQSDTDNDGSGDACDIDTDGDGVDDAIEQAAPNGGDGNGDGIPDSQQNTVASLPAATGSGYLTLQSSCQLLDVSVITAGAIPTPDPGHGYPHGLIAFRAPCSSATFSLFVYGSAAVSTYRKFGPLPPGGPQQWYGIPSTFSVATVGSLHPRRIDFSLTDGGTGDDTPVDGVIVDQGGPASPTDVPTLSEWALIAMAMALAAFAALKLKT